MQDGPTLADVLELSIGAEREAESFYRELVQMFAASPEVAAYWEEMMLDESEHAGHLESMRDAMTAEQLSSPEAPEAYFKVKKFLRFSAKDRLRGIKNLDDAYRAAVDLEFSEVNKLMELLLAKDMLLHGSIGVSLERLKIHGEKVRRIPAIFGDTSARCAIEVSGKY